MHSSYRTVGRSILTALWISAVACLDIRMNAAESISPAEALVTAHRPLVIAHRCFSLFAPENTLPAFASAKKAGADLIELDYHHTKDGVPLVIHDFDLDRTTDAQTRFHAKKIPVISKTLQEVRDLDAGSWFSPGLTEVRLPTLEEALELIQKGGITLIERKAGDPATCIKLLREEKLVNHVVVQSFDWDYLKEFHQLEPRQLLGALGPQGSRNGRKLSDAEKVLDRVWVDQVQAIGARVVVWNRNVTPESVDYAHDRGLKVWIYTIDDPAVANQLLNHKVDGIISNNPSIIWRTLALRAGTP